MSPEEVYTYLRLDTVTAPTEGFKFLEVRVETCTKIGTVVLSSTLVTTQNSRALGDYLWRMYEVDLTFQVDGNIHDTRHRVIDVTFNDTDNIHP